MMTRGRENPVCSITENDFEQSRRRRINVKEIIGQLVGVRSSVF